VASRSSEVNFKKNYTLLYLFYTAIRCMVHWPLTGELLHLMQRGRAWVGCGKRGKNRRHMLT